jgi:phosphate transport system substrate-binding protein
MKTTEKSMIEFLVTEFKSYRVKATLIMAAMICCSMVMAQKEPQAITITGSKFTYPLIEKWISEYKKENPEAQFKLISKKSESAPSDISIIAHQPLKTDVTDANRIVYVNKYALLPVTGSSNKYLKEIKKRGLNKKELEKLFFQEADLDENPEEKTQKPVSNPVNIYSRESQASSSIAFASYFGFQSSEIKGKKISGDDIYLISSIQKDSTGVTFNNLGYLFDLQTRKLKEGIVLLPLDIDEKAKTSINTNVDEALTAIENTKFETIPVEKVGLIFDNNPGNKEILNFVKWVVNEGQKFNHEFGFLNLDKKLQAEQVAKLTENYLTVK